MDIVVAVAGVGVQLTPLTDDLEPGPPTMINWDEFPAAVAKRESGQPRWVWADTTAFYPKLLAASVRVARCADLRLCHTILRNAASREASASIWDEPVALPDEVPNLLDSLETVSDFGTGEVLAEHQAQQAAVREAPDPGRLRLLLAAESAGALIAAELKHHGLPLDVSVHDQLLTELLGPRPRHGGRPAKLEALVIQIRELLNAPGLNPESPVELLRSLRAAGLEATTTRQWEIEKLDHPVAEPLLEYKKLSRLLSANGWAWLDAWVRNGRFRADYVPGGVVTGRWATNGGGALQLPKQIRAAVRAEEGYKLVVADAAQLEPRVLAAMARDAEMAKAGYGKDLYQGLVDNGIVDTRAHAKVAMLGALYGATTGEAGLLMPRLLRAYPKATGLVENAARDGERGVVVRTWLGRTSPPPGESWQHLQRLAGQVEATDTDERNARRQARDWGRFTRNFVVQGTAAEWALCWIAGLRTRLSDLSYDGEQPQLVFFLHDEVMVHTPAALAGDVTAAISSAADEAGRLLFGSFPVDFAISIACVDNYAEAK